ncbi:MAG: ArnT family glycosyltransferase [bacterium]
MTTRLRQWLRLNRTAVALFVVSCLTKLAFTILLVADPHLFIYNPDSEGYLQIAENLNEHGQFSESIAPPLAPDNLRTPLYPLFLAAVLWLSGGSLVAVVVVQILLSSLTVVVVYLFGRILLSELSGRIAAVLLLLDLSAFVFANGILTETLFALLFLVAVFALYRYFVSLKWSWLFVAAGVLGLAALCRPIALYFYTPALLLFVVRFGWRWRAVRQWLVFSAAFAVVVAPWFVRNYVVFRVWNFTSIHYLLNAAYLEADQRGLTVQQAELVLEDEAEPLMPAQANEAQRARVYRRFALEKILSAPLRYTKVHLAGLVPMLIDNNARDISYFLGHGRGLTGARALFFQRGPQAGLRALFSGKGGPALLVFFFLLILQLVVYFCAAYGFVLVWRGAGPLPALLLAAAAVYLVFLALPAGSVRFRFPAMPYLYLLAGYGLASIYRVTRRK